MWREKEFWPHIFSTTLSSFLDIPLSTFRCHIHYQQGNDLIPNYVHLCSITICNKTEQKARSFQSLNSSPIWIVVRNVHRGSWNYWKSDTSHNIPIPVMIPVCEMAKSGTGKEWKKPIPKIREREFPLTFRVKRPKEIKWIRCNQSINGATW